MIYFSISFDLDNLWSFLIGIFFGMSFLALIYLCMILASINKRFKKRNPKNAPNKDEIIYLIDEAKEKFKDKELRQKQSNIPYLSHICKDLVNDIAEQFYPNSKYPIYELSIDEVLELLKYISDRLNEILDKKGIRVIKKITIAKIIEISDVKKNIDESKLVKLSSKYKVKQIFKAAMGAINIVNPVYWTKKIIISTATNIVLKKICLIAISIVGEETYKIYSKKVFDVEENIDSGISKIEETLDEELKKLNDEEIKDLSNLDILVEGEENNALDQKKEKTRRRK